MLNSMFLYVLLSKKNLVELEGPYYTILIHFTIHNILFSISTSLILEPALLGIAPQFYKENAYWLARIELTKATVLLLVGTVAHFLIALNRLTAIILPLKHLKIWTNRRVHIVFCIAWIIVFVIAIPIFVDVEPVGSHFSVSVFNSTAVHFFFIGAYDGYYQMGCAFFGMFVYTSTLLVYIAMLYSFRQIRKLSPIRSSSISFSQVLKSSITSFLMTTGGWLIQILITAMFAHLWLFSTPLLSLGDFSVLFRLFNALHNVLMPWVMVCSFKTIRRIVFALQPAHTTPATVPTSCRAS